MAKNRRFADGRHLSLPVTAGTESGDPVAVGNLIGVAVTDRDADGNATVDLGTVGAVYEVEVEANDGAIDIGDPVYIGVDGSLSNTAGQLFGFALEGVESAATSNVNVRLASPTDSGGS